MKFWLLTLISLLIVSGFSFASGDPYPIGGRASGMANASVTFTDAWSLFNNPGGIAGNKSMYALFAYDNRFGLPGMQHLAAGFVYPTAYGTTGFSISRFGDELYSEHLAGIAYGHEINHVRLGMKLNYLQVHISDLGTRGNATLEFGVLANISPQITLGAHIYNLNQAKLAEYQDERIPTVMKAGIAYQPFEKFVLAAETEKDIDFPARTKMGIEYEIVKNFRLRTGIATKPYSNHFGIGFSPKNAGFDYALRTHPILGLSHHISLVYRINKKSKPGSKGAINTSSN